MAVPGVRSYHRYRGRATAATARYDSLVPAARRAPFGSRPIVTAVAIEAALAAVALGLGYAFGAPAAATLAWSPSAIAIGVLATAPMLALFAVFMVLELAPFRAIRELLDRFIGMYFEGATWKGIALVSLAAGFAEELLFRGFLQAALEPLVGVVPAVLLASLAFGLAHAVTATYVVIATLFGIYFGWLWLATGNLLTVVTAHALYDFVALMLMIEAKRRQAPRNDVQRPIAT